MVSEMCLISANLVFWHPFCSHPLFRPAYNTYARFRSPQSKFQSLTGVKMSKGDEGVKQDIWRVDNGVSIWSRDKVDQTT